MNEFTGVEIFKRAYNIYDKFLSEVARENNLTLNQLKILMFLENCNGINIAKNVVDGLGTTKSHVSMSVSDLEKKGYIEKNQDENNKKRSNLQLTEKSYKVIKLGNEIKKNIKEIMFKGISKEEIIVLNNISQKVKENLESYTYFEL